jgi:hypothetical protein
MILPALTSASVLDEREPKFLATPQPDLPDKKLQRHRGF